MTLTPFSPLQNCVGHSFFEQVLHEADFAGLLLDLNDKLQALLFRFHGDLENIHGGQHLRLDSNNLKLLPMVDQCNGKLWAKLSDNDIAVSLADLIGAPEKVLNPICYRPPVSG